MKGWINVDVNDQYQPMDEYQDCIYPDLAPSKAIFSHAFFEHLPREVLVPHLTLVREALIEGGFMCYLGIPNFKEVAIAYTSYMFNTDDVYNITHGNSDSYEGDFNHYFWQLHKDIFDADYLNTLLSKAGFQTHIVFSYTNPGDRIDNLNLGFFTDTLDSMHQFLQEVPNPSRFIKPDSVQVL